MASTAANLSRRIPHSVIVRAPGLLPMLYKTSELAEELDIPRSRLHNWVRDGLPCQRDGRGHLWINGEELAAWVETQRTARRGPSLAPDQAYCLRCHRAVIPSDPTRRVRGKQVLLQGTCPECGTKVNRGVSRGQPA